MRGTRPHGDTVKDKLFTDARAIDRSDDSLQVDYTTGQVTARIWREHLRPRWRILILSGLAMAVAAATTGAVPLLIQMAADDVFVGKKADMIAFVTWAVIGVTFLKAVSEFVGKMTVNYLGLRFIADMRIRMFEKLARADLSWIDQVHSGRFLAGFLNDANLIRQTASQVLVALGENLAKVIALTAVIFWLDWRLASLILICMPIGIVLLGRQRRKMRKSTTKSMQETGDISSQIAQTLRGIRIVRAYGQEEQEIARARRAINRAMEFTLRGARASALSSPAVEVLTGLGFALAIYYAGTQGLAGRMTLGHFMGFMAATMLLYQPLKSLGMLQTVLQEGVAAASRVFGIIDREIALQEAPDAQELKVTKGEIVFDDVHFSYAPDAPVFEGLSLTIPAGKTVALVGPSGGGKSTILNLVLRFYDPQKGQIRIDGQDIAKATFKSLRKATALVTQEPVLFDDTVRANIAYGSPEASQADIERAAKIAAAHDFIMALPEGYDTRVGEAGNALSGGERQRIAIARAILKDAPILLLDEPTSALDAKAEAKVQKALEGLMQGRTVLMIAHRLSSIIRADLICVLDKGKIVEMGRHDELIQKDGLYRHLYETQFGAGATKPTDGQPPSGGMTKDPDPEALSPLVGGA